MPHVRTISTPQGSEDAIIARIASHFPNTGEEVLLGRGDDCAVLRAGSPLCISTDLFMEDVHFRRGYFSPQDIGWKALAVNLSDLAACGARPSGFTVGLSLPPDADMELVDGLCEGMARLAEQASAPLVGGDLSRADRLHLCITVFGRAAAPLLRGAPLPGDAVFLVGEIGLARTGLQLLEERGRSAIADWPSPCAAHLHPVPRLPEGLILAGLAAEWHPEKPEQFIGRTGSAETVHSDYGTGEPDVFLPAEFGRRFYGNPRRIAKNFFLITDILAIKQLHTGH